MTPTSGLAPDWTAIALVVLLLAACVPLYFSMRKHMRRIQVPTLPEIQAAERGERSHREEARP